jgi:hypothetical protein
MSSDRTIINNDLNKLYMKRKQLQSTNTTKKVEDISNINTLIALNEYVLVNLDSNDQSPIMLNTLQTSLESNLKTILTDIDYRKKQQEILSTLNNNNKTEVINKINMLFNLRIKNYQYAMNQDWAKNDENMTLMMENILDSIILNSEHWFNVSNQEISIIKEDQDVIDSIFAPTTRSRAKKMKSDIEPIDITSYEKPFTSEEIEFINELYPNVDTNIDPVDINVTEDRAYTQDEVTMLQELFPDEINIDSIRAANTIIKTSESTNVKLDTNNGHKKAMKLALSEFEKTDDVNSYEMDIQQWINKTELHEYSRVVWFESLARRCKTQETVDCESINNKESCESNYLTCDWNDGRRRTQRDKQATSGSCSFKTDKTLCDVFSNLWNVDTSTRKVSNMMFNMLKTDEVELLEDLYTIDAQLSSKAEKINSTKLKTDEDKMIYKISQQLNRSISSLFYLPFKTIKALIKYTKTFRRTMMYLGLFTSVVLIGILLFMIEPVLMEVLSQKSNFATRNALILFYETFRWCMCLLLPFIPEIVTKFVQTVARSDVLANIAAYLADGTLVHTGKIVRYFYKFIGQLVSMSASQASDFVKEVINHFVICGDKTVAYVGPNKDRVVMTVIEKTSILSGNQRMRETLLNNVKDAYYDIESLKDVFSNIGEYNTSDLIGWFSLYIQNILGLYTPLSLGGQVQTISEQDITMFAFIAANPASAMSAFKVVGGVQVDIGTSMISTIMKGFFPFM